MYTTVSQKKFKDISKRQLSLVNKAAESATKSDFKASLRVGSCLLYGSRQCVFGFEQQKNPCWKKGMSFSSRRDRFSSKNAKAKVK